MKTTLKRCTLLTLALLMLAAGIYVPLKKARAATTYNNTTSATMNSSISSSGHLHTVLSVTGIKGKTTRIGVELYLEKRFLGLFWKRVDIGYTNNVWIDSTTSTTYTNTFDFDLSSTGTYRTTVTYTVSGSGGADDVIVITDTDTY